MTYLEAIVLGVIQGATEWLPISSTAHLRVVPALLGWKDPGSAFTAVSQLGTVLAALVYFRRDIADIVLGFATRFDADERPGRRLLLPIVAGTIPVIITGYLLRDYISGPFRSLWVVASSLIVFALVLAYAEKRRSARRGISTVTVMDGMAVGIGQTFSLIPGASRSGTTITAALLMGLERSAAARFSFILSLPAITAAGFFEFWREREAILSDAQFGPTVVATVVAFIVGWATIYWLIGFLRTRSTFVFIWYRIALGMLILALVAGGRVPATDDARAPAPVAAAPVAAAPAR
ncbi:MAG TPA: undecaprenyl-diphosphatase UppP [Chthonomonadales bacterium]|nr:undecaprenyl-diphosphatase UppP [Chthonomonadales bacterium]